MKTPPEYLLLDFETTGLDPQQSEVIEIGALKMKGLEIQAQFQALVQPRSEIPTVITHITGISQEDVQNEPLIETVWPLFLEFAGDLPMVAHNASMENRFLKKCEIYGNRRVFEVYDSIEALAIALPEQPSYSLENLRRWAGLTSKGAHRALKDCEDLAALLIKTHATLLNERPQIAEVIRQIYPPNQWELWWWNWFFERSPHPRRQAESSDKSRTPAPTLSTLLLERMPQNGLQSRESQRTMANAVETALAATEESPARLAIEAPTGTGKSLGYLLPALRFSKIDESPIIISTHSRTLQDQLLRKDFPLAQTLFNDKSLNAVTVKGQQNYLCLRKLHEATFDLQNQESPQKGELWSLAYLHAFASITNTAEVQQVSRYLRSVFEPLDSLIDQVQSHHTTTIGPECPHYKSCHFFNSARNAKNAEVIISNHALTFQWPQHLPPVKRIIFDEAHHLEDQLTDAFTLSLNARDLSLALKRLQPLKHSDLEEVSGSIALALSLCEPLSGGEHRFQPDIAFGANELHLRHAEPVLERLNALFDPLIRIKKILSRILDRIPPQQKSPLADTSAVAQDRVENAIQFIEAFKNPEVENFLRNFNWGPPWKSALIPIDVSEYGKMYFSHRDAVILTTATLTAPGNPDFIFKRVGFEPTSPLLTLPSPYSLKEQAALYIPKDAPLPGTEAHLHQIIEFTAQCVRKIEGRTLLLFSSNARLRTAAEALRKDLEKDGFAVFDSLTDANAAEAFRHSSRAVLIGSEKMGEGLDIPGPALSLVILEKINEAMTRGPLAEARKKLTPFPPFDYDFPLRMIWLKQRVGRLIRSSSDRGAIVIFDSRYYGWSPKSKSLVKSSVAPIEIHEVLKREILLNLESNVEPVLSFDTRLKPQRVFQLEPKE